MKRSSVQQLAATMALLALGCGGCSSGGSGPADPVSEPQVADVRVITQESQIRLPFDAYNLTVEQRVQYDRANYLLTKQCMERFGVPFTEPLQNPTVYNDMNNDRLFGLFNIQVARQYGFQAPPDPKAAAAERQYHWNPSPAEQAVLGSADSPNSQFEDQNGDPVPEGGCAGEALRRLSFFVPSTSPVDSHELYTRAIADSRTQAAFQSWSKCMASRGFDYESPIDIFEKSWNRPVTPVEVDTAVAHVQCAKSTNMVGIWVSVLSAYQDRAIEENPEYYANEQQHNLDMMEAAAAAINGQ